MSIWETVYILKPPPSCPEALEDSPSPPASPTEKSKTTGNFSYNKGQGPNKMSVVSPYNWLFYEERMLNGIAKQLIIHQLGHYGSDQFDKYSDTVEVIEFRGYIEHMDSCFSICGIMKNLKDVRFVPGRVISSKSLKPLKPSLIEELDRSNPTVSNLVIRTDLSNYKKLSDSAKELAEKYIDVILELSKKQFCNISSLRLEIPETDQFIKLSKSLVSLPNLPKNGKLEIATNYKITCKLENSTNNVKSSSQTTVHKIPAQKIHTSSQKKEDFSRKEDAKCEKPKVNPTVPVPVIEIVGDVEENNATFQEPQRKLEPQQVTTKRVSVSSPPTPSPVPGSTKSYSYEFSTAERLLMESVIAASQTPSVSKEARTTGSKRPGETVTDPPETKRLQTQWSTKGSSQSSEPKEKTTPVTTSCSNTTAKHDDFQKRNLHKDIKNIKVEIPMRRTVARSSSVETVIATPTLRNHENAVEGSPVSDVSVESVSSNPPNIDDFKSSFYRRGEDRERDKPERHGHNIPRIDHTQNERYGKHDRGYGNGNRYPRRGRGRGRSSSSYYNNDYRRPNEFDNRR